jgi:hypothetical protein
VYKKFILSLMFLPLFSSSESLCMDPVTLAIVLAAIPAIGTPIINNASSYFFPTPVNTAVVEAAKIEAAKLRKQLNYLDENSKPEGDKTAHGAPLACKEVMLAFILCGGNSENEAIAMTALFNKYNKN